MFCPILSNFLLSLQVALALIWITSIPGLALCHLRQWPGSCAFSVYWNSYCHHQRQHTGWDRPLVWLTTAFLIFCGGSCGRQNFFHFSCFQSVEIFVDILAKSICFFSQNAILPVWKNWIYQAQGTWAENLSLEESRGHHGAHKQCDVDVFCSPDTIGCYRLLTEFSVQPASLTVHRTHSSWERQSQAGTLHRGECEWKSDELHPLVVLQIWNISDLVKSALIFHPKQPDHSCRNILYTSPLLLSLQCTFC